jgi:hypothetical protein
MRRSRQTFVTQAGQITRKAQLIVTDIPISDLWRLVWPFYL